MSSKQISPKSLNKQLSPNTQRYRHGVCCRLCHRQPKQLTRCPSNSHNCLGNPHVLYSLIPRNKAWTRLHLALHLTLYCNASLVTSTHELLTSYWQSTARDFPLQCSSNSRLTLTHSDLNINRLIYFFKNITLIYHPVYHCKISVTIPRYADIKT